MKYVALIIPLVYFVILFVWSEIRICRKGHDSWDWIKQLVKWIDTK